MPVAKIHVLEGRYDEARLGRVSNAVQQGLISALGIPPDDFFQIIHVLPATQFRHTRSFLELNYSDDLILLEITFIAGRPKEKRLGLLKALNDAVVTAANISPDDLLITLYETPGENISFGRGLAQRAHISDKEKVASRQHVGDRSFSRLDQRRGRGSPISASRRPPSRSRQPGSFCSRCNTSPSTRTCVGV